MLQDTGNPQLEKFGGRGEEREREEKYKKKLRCLKHVPNFSFSELKHIGMAEEYFWVMTQPIEWSCCSQ
jgi:hypothetical protein